jgi:hypothetical protein
MIKDRQQSWGHRASESHDSAEGFRPLQRGLLEVLRGLPEETDPVDAWERRRDPIDLYEAWLGARRAVGRLLERAAGRDRLGTASAEPHAGAPNLDESPEGERQ